MKLRWMRCMISFLTERRAALDPAIFRMITGWMLPTPRKSPNSIVPPATFRKGRTVSRTRSTASGVSSGPPSPMSWTTSMISGIASRRLFSRPIFMVIVEDGHVPHAPSSFNRTTPPSMSVTRTFPPSAMRYGRDLSSVFSTFSRVRARGPSSLASGSYSSSSSSSSFVPMSTDGSKGETIPSAIARKERAPRLERCASTSGLREPSCAWGAA
mmetsp:Transcript_55346/g.131451  ORF Transcript_55346/g.131451 Transcript_55346/m.131451 type:complete len:213 (+) Transcript_55346:333-971(+)